MQHYTYTDDITCIIIDIICDDITNDTVFHATMQVLFVNEAIQKALHGSPLHGLAPIVDPSNETIEVLLAALRWDMQQRRFGLMADGLEKLHALSVELLVSAWPAQGKHARQNRDRRRQRFGFRKSS